MDLSRLLLVGLRGVLGEVITARVRVRLQQHYIGAAHEGGGVAEPDGRLIGGSPLIPSKL